MKKKALLILTFCFLFCLALAIGVSAECAECDYEYTVELGQNGYFDSMSSSAKCKVCGTTTTATIDPIFIPLGYSYSDDGVCQGYAINRDSLAKYEEQTQEEVTFGAVIATRNSIGNANPLDKDGNPISDKVKTVDLTDTKYDIIDVVIRGIPDLLKSSAELVFSMYVNAGGRISYLDNSVQKSNCGEATYNEIVDSPAKGESTVTPLIFVNGKAYTRLEIDFTQAKYWYNSSLGDSANNPTFNNKFWGTTNSYTKETLPVGSLIILNDLEDGWQYRPHKWSGTRPINTKVEVTEVTEQWWSSFTYVGFNISQTTVKTSGATENTNSLADISGYTEAQIKEVFQILIPYVESEGTTTPDEEEPNVDYSAQKQNWDNDGELKILAIGNSFSVDSMQWIYQVAQDAGIEKVTLGNLYIGGCTLATHLSNAKNDSASYTYYTNTSGSWSNTGSYKISTAVQSDDWDFITFQQASGSSGVESTYADLDALIDIVEPLNPSARLAWHMTWAYQGNSSHVEFSKYDNDQMTMYNAITSAVQNQVLADGRIEIVIPAGTAIQNSRTSYVGDTLTRDGYHLSYDLGRFIGSLSYVKALTGKSIDNITYAPDGVDETERLMAIEAVSNAVATPYAVTNSTYTSAPEVEAPETPAVPEGYRQLSATDLELLIGAFYNTDDSNNPYDYDTSDEWNLGFASTKKLTKSDLPIGTIIQIADGWQYRPERWEIVGSRPENVTTSSITIDSAWWGTYTYRAFNISQTSHAWGSNVVIPYDEETIANAIFRVYVPLNPVVDEGEGEDTEEEATEIPAGYREETLTLYQYAYYNTNSAKTEPKLEQKTESDGVGKKYYATQVFTKETLPVGSIIYVHSDWNYRPEGWVYDTVRPDQVQTKYVYVDDAWWGTYTQRAFNISRDDGASMSSYTEEDINKIFKIFIPDSTVQMEQMSIEDLGLTKEAFWWSTNTVYHEQITNHADAPKYFSTRIFTKEELVIGTVIEIDSAWVYRPEGWVDGAQNSERPTENQTVRIVVTEEWWGNYTERAFNIALDTKASITDYTIEDVAQIFKIYIPVTE